VKKKDGNFRIFLKLLKELSSISPLQFCFMYFCFAVDGLIFTLLVGIKERVFDSAIGFYVEHTGLAKTVFYIVVMFMFYVLNSVFNALGNYYAEIYDIKAIRYMHGKINEKSRGIRAIQYEDAVFLDKVEKSYSGANAGMAYLNSVMDLVFMYSPFIVFMAIYLWSKKPSLVLIILLIFVPTIYSQRIKKREYRKLEDELAPIRRRYKSLNQSILSLSGWREAKVCGAFGFLRSEIKSTVLLIQKLKNRVERIGVLYDLSAKMVNLLGYFGIMYLLFREMMTGGISIGVFTAVIFSVDELYSLMEEAIVGRYGESSSKIPMIRNYFEFLECDEETRTKEITNGKIVLKDVSFRYPNAHADAIKRISLSIEDGEKIAIVGENGAGKTTLAKLLSGIFTPSAGLVIIGGHNSSEINYNGISQVFQNFNRYRLSMRDNIRISDYTKEPDDEEILGIVREFGLSHEGLDTLLSKEFGGIDISHGQWQRVAIARGLYRRNQILILDEPTAAIDPIEENYMFEKFREFSEGRTTIIITHRLSLVRFVDRIILLKNGQLEGFDTHENLLRKSEYYRTMWELQSQRYLQEKSRAFSTGSRPVKRCQFGLPSG